MIDNIPTSAGFERRNAILGLELTLQETFLLAHDDPEALDLFRQRSNTLQVLRQTENRVQDRASRMRSLRHNA